MHNDSSWSSKGAHIGPIITQSWTILVTCPCHLRCLNRNSLRLSSFSSSLFTGFRMEKSTAAVPTSKFAAIKMSVLNHLIFGDHSDPLKTIYIHWPPPFGKCVVFRKNPGLDFYRSSLPAQLTSLKQLTAEWLKVDCHTNLCQILMLISYPQCCPGQ